MDSRCFKCYKFGHLSINCLEPPKHTRCYLCRRVCEKPEDHYWARDNKNFISQSIEQPNSTRSATLISDMKFDTKANLYLMDGPKSINISNEFLPIQIDANYGLLLGQKKQVKYYQWFPDQNHRCVINVMNSRNDVRFSARFMNDFFVVNKKIRVRSNGNVETRDEIPENEILPAELTLKVGTESKFNITIFAFDKYFTFEITSDDVVYLPPKWTGIECSICYDSMVGADVKMTPCGHLSCTGCIYQSLFEKSECPICRKRVIIDNLRDIFLYN